MHTTRSTKTPQVLTKGSVTYVMPANALVYINNSALHTNPKTWGPDSLAFRPTRWLSQDSTAEDVFVTMPRGQFIPWSGGPRVCPGQKMSQVEFVAVIATIFKRYRVAAIPEKDETDLFVLAEAERLNLPVLAICYGMQALNVFRGGSLIQDIESQIKGSIKHEQGAPAIRGSHSLKIEKSSFLGDLAAVKSGKGTIRVNSSHHQAIGRVGKNLKAVAWAKDGVIEGIQDTRKGRFVYGVQWHPELSHGGDSLSREIFELFIGKCLKP